MEEKTMDVNSSAPSTGEPIAEPVSEDVKTQEKAETPEEVPAKPAPQTIPYDRFRQVNEEKKALEEEVKKLRSSIPSEELASKYPDWEFLSDEQKGFITRQEQLEKDIQEMKEEKAWSQNLANALSLFPQLKGKEQEFKEFCYNEENIGVKNLSLLAKAFVFDKDEPEPEIPLRKGLEKPTGGPKQVPSAEMSLEDIKRLRETNEKLYIKMIREGRIKKVPEK